MVEIRHLRYFIAAVEEGTLLDAAQRVHIAQPALSRRIRDLEQELGCELLTRSQRGVTATPAGMAFYRRALRVIDELDDACDEAREIGLAQGRAIRFGILNTSRKYAFIHEATIRFQEQHPECPVRFVADFSHRMSRMLADHELDLALVYGTQQRPPNTARQPIHQERMILAAHPRHALAREGPASLQELHRVPLTWLNLRGNPEFQNALRQELLRQGVELVIARTAHSYEEMIDLTIASGGAMIVVASTVGLVAPGALVFRPLPELQMRYELCLDWDMDFATSPGCAILTSLRTAISEHQQQIRSGGMGDASLFGHSIIEAPENEFYADPAYTSRP